MIRWLLPLLLASGMAAGQGVTPESYIEALSSTPGAETRRFTEGDAEVVEVRRAGVLSRQERRGDRRLTVEMDQSGHGAVLCHWQFQVIQRGMLDLCRPDGFAEAREDVSEAIGATLDFVVANDAARRPRDYWEAYMRRMEASAAVPPGVTLDAAALARACTTGPGGAFLTRWLATSRTERRRSLADLLAVPRQPVMNPCL